jgi:ubiquinone/menaquinone biosynthesis C-methylase UbiE
MIDESLVPLLRCPTSRQPMQLDRDAGELGRLNTDIAQGRVGFASGQAVDGTVQAILRAADGSAIYPVVDDVACLLGETRIVPASNSQPLVSTPAREREVQHQQMAKYSEVYERWTGGEDGITRALQKVLDARYRSMFAGASVLDVGNGGTPAEVQLGREIAGVIDRFIALDRSSHMLRRSGSFGNQILGDAFELPFEDGAVDIVMVNNTIHHFGRRAGDDPTARLGSFLNEAMRVARKGVVGVELLVPPLGEFVESQLLRMAGFMPTYVYSAPFYRRAFTQIDGRVTDFKALRLGQLISPWKIFPPVLDFTWMRVPAFLVPYSFLFFSIEK